MAQLKKLQIGDNHAKRYTKEYLLTDYTCHVNRLHNEYRPDNDKYCDSIDLTIIAPGKEDMLLYDWFIKQYTLSGRILIQLPPLPNQSESDLREVYFEEAQCFSFEEEYHINLSQRRTLKIRMVAEDVNISGVTFKRQ